MLAEIIYICSPFLDLTVLLAESTFQSSVTAYNYKVKKKQNGPDLTSFGSPTMQLIAFTYRRLKIGVVAEKYGWTQNLRGK